MIRNADKLTDDDCGACGYGVLEVGYVANAKTIGGEKTILRLGLVWPVDTLAKPGFGLSAILGTERIDDGGETAALSSAVLLEVVR